MHRNFGLRPAGRIAVDYAREEREATNVAREAAESASSCETAKRLKTLRDAERLTRIGGAGINPACSPP